MNAVNDRRKTRLLVLTLRRFNRLILVQWYNKESYAGRLKLLAAKTKIGLKVLQSLERLIGAPLIKVPRNVVAASVSPALFKTMNVDLAQQKELYDRFFGPCYFEPFSRLPAEIAEQQLVELNKKVDAFLSELTAPYMVNIENLTVDERNRVFREKLVEYSGTSPYERRLTFLKAVITGAITSVRWSYKRKAFIEWFPEWQKALLESLEACWSEETDDIGTYEEYSDIFYDSRFENAIRILSKIGWLPNYSVKGSITGCELNSINPMDVVLIPELRQYMVEIIMDYWYSGSRHPERFGDRLHALLARSIGHLFTTDFGEDFYRTFADMSIKLLPLFGSTSVLFTTFAASKVQHFPQRKEVLEAGIRRLMREENWLDFRRFNNRTDPVFPPVLDSVFWNALLKHLALVKKEELPKIPAEFWARFFRFTVENPSFFPDNIQPLAKCLHIFELKPPVEFLGIFLRKYDIFLDGDQESLLKMTHTIGATISYFAGPPFNGKLLPDERILEKSAVKIEAAMNNVEQTAPLGEMLPSLAVFFSSYSGLKGAKRLPKTLWKRWYEISEGNVEYINFLKNLARMLKAMVTVENYARPSRKLLEQIEKRIVELCEEIGSDCTGEQERAAIGTILKAYASSNLLKPSRDTVRALCRRLKSEMLLRPMTAPQISECIRSIDVLLNDRDRRRVLNSEFWINFWANHREIFSAPCSCQDLVLIIQSVQQAVAVSGEKPTDSWFKSWCEVAVEKIDDFTAAELVAIGYAWQMMGKTPFFAEFLENWLVLVVARATQFKSLSQIITVLKTLVTWKIRLPTSYLNQLMEAAEDLSRNEQLVSLASLIRGFSSLNHKISKNSTLLSQVAHAARFGIIENTLSITNALQALLIQQVVLGGYVPESIASDLLVQLGKFEVQCFSEADRSVIQRSKLVFGESVLPLKILKIMHSHPEWSFLTSHEIGAANKTDGSKKSSTGKRGAIVRNQQDLALDRLIEKIQRNSEAKQNQLLPFERKLEMFKQDAASAISNLFQSYGPKHTEVLHNVRMAGIGCTADTLVTFLFRGAQKSIAFQLIGPENFFRTPHGKLCDLLRPECVLIQKLLELAGHTVEMVMYSEWIEAREKVLQRINVRYLDDL